MPKLEPIDSIPEANPVEERFKRKPNPERVPQWAKELTQKVCFTYGVETPIIRWRQSTKAVLTAGTHFIAKEGSWISLTVGSDTVRQKVVLLHELAHYIEPREHHSKVFYRRAWELYSIYLKASEWEIAWYVERNYRMAARLTIPLPIYQELANRGVFDAPS